VSYREYWSTMATEPKFSEIIKAVDGLDRVDGNWTSVKIAFLRNITVDPVVPYLKFYCYQDGIRADVYMGDYDNAVQEAASIDSPLYQYSPDVVIICLKLQGVGIQDTSIADTVRLIIDGIRNNSNATILLHNFTIPVYHSSGVLGSRGEYSRANTVRMINDNILDAVSEYDNAYIADIDLLQSIIGYQRFIDNRYWHIAKMPYTREAFSLIAQEYMKFIRALKGKNSKCLVLDCDNTLWGGIIGEDGINKIAIGKTYPGSAFLGLQDTILGLYDRGILLAVCSKNNEQDVLEVLDKHPDMVLRREHFVATRINWNDKVVNLREIAEELSIGLDSMVLMDDSEFEISMVKQLLPEVKTIHLSGDPSSYADILGSCGLFGTLMLSEEDRKRNEMYRADAGRKRAKDKFQDMTLDDYYRYLEMEVIIHSADEFSIPRIAQLTQRANQFNLTTRRYTESEIKELAEGEYSEVRYLRLKDRFGDMGIVGVAILKYHGDTALIDTFLLSCRIIGRGVEDILLKDCIDRATIKYCGEIIGVYEPTAKNSQVEKFYENRGFIFLEKGVISSEYGLSLDRTLPDLPNYFKSVGYNNR